VKGLLVIHGGSAVAILAFIQAIIDKQGVENILTWAALSLTGFAIGLFTTSWINWLRYLVSHHYGTKRYSFRWWKWKIYWFTTVGLSLFSPFIFLASSYLLALGVFQKFAPNIFDMLVLDVLRGAVPS